MTSFAIDTYKVVIRLQQHGYTKQQAEGLVAVLRSADLADVASQADIADLKDRLNDLNRHVQATRVELYKVAAAQTLVIVGAVVALVQVL
jgi:hypothetical protein